jgi:alpha-L-fucosidase
MKVNGESIYGTKASPLKAQPAWGRATRKGDTIYLHVFDWPLDGKLTVEGLKAPPKSAYLLAGKTNLKFTTLDGSTMIELPEKPLDPIDTVIVLKLENVESMNK